LSSPAAGGVNKIKTRAKYFVQFFVVKSSQ